MRSLSSRPADPASSAPGRRQRLADADELADMGQQALQEPEPAGLPAAAADGIRYRPHEAQPVRVVEVRVQAVPGAQAAVSLVVHRRRLALLLGPEVGEMHQPALGTLHEAAHARVPGMVDVEVLARQVVPALATVKQASEVNAVLAAGPFADHEAAAPGAACLVDPGRGGRPAAFVNRGLIK